MYCCKLFLLLRQQHMIFMLSCDYNIRNQIWYFSIFRGKSRSVDHGLSSPFDLDSLRSKVEGRFESVDKLNRGEFLKTFFQLPF